MSDEIADDADVTFYGGLEGKGYKYNLVAELTTPVGQFIGRINVSPTHDVEELVQTRDAVQRECNSMAFLVIYEDKFSLEGRLPQGVIETTIPGVVLRNSVIRFLIERLAI